MLTHNDVTIKNAFEIFEECKNTNAKYWGFKEIGLSLEEMKKLCNYMKENDKTTILEVVAYTEEECLKGAQTALYCQFDILMGTIYFDSVNELCQKNNIKYMPFVGTVNGRPSILTGEIDDIIYEAKKIINKNVYGFDLLGYRYNKDAVSLNNKFVSSVNAPVCIAGSINNFERLDEVKKANPKFFTIGGAFFENKFGNGIAEQINKVCDYIKK